MAAQATFDQALRARLLFARMFFKHPRMLGSVLPSSRFLSEKLLNSVDWRHAEVVVEYGPGVGNMTTDILERMGPNARLICIERNAEFVDYLRETVRDPRLHVVHGSAEEIRAVLARFGFEGADCVISGIPFSTLPDEVRQNILRETRFALRPAGVLLVYQFTRTVLRDLRVLFGRVDEDFEPRNILPARIFSCLRDGAAGD